jgi:hypothetical protein
MSYEIFKHRDITLEGAWLLTLVGRGEHEGTVVTLPQRRLYELPFSSESKMAAYLDRLFLRAHADRLDALAAGARSAETTQLAQSEGRQSGGSVSERNAQPSPHTPRGTQYG